MPVVMQADNTTACAKSNFGLMVLAMLVCKHVFISAGMMFLRVRHIHGDVGLAASFVIARELCVCVVADADVLKWGVSTHFEARHISHVA